MERETGYRQQQIQEYKQGAMPLLRYLPWLEQHEGKKVSSTYADQSLTEHSVAFPVYDGTLLNFVREAQKSPFMDKNYRYTYSRHNIRTHADEHKLIKNAGIEQWGTLCGILSYYVCGGRTKGNLWNEAVQEGIFCDVLRKMKEIIEYWDRPFEV